MIFTLITTSRLIFLIKTIRLQRGRQQNRAGFDQFDAGCGRSIKMPTGLKQPQAFVVHVAAACEKNV